MLYGDYHTHTIYSHGTGTIRDNVEKAYEEGLTEIAICDHGPGHFLYGVKEEKLYEMRKEIDLLNEEYNDKGLKILLGIEANVMNFDGDIDVNENILEILDILLLGYHYGIMPKRFKDAARLYILNPISKVLPIGRDKIIKKNTDALISAINRYPVNIITHPGSKAKVDVKRLAREAKKSGVCLEINSKHSELSVENIKLAASEDVDFVLGSDAHSKDRVADITSGLARARLAGLDESRIINLKSEV